MDHLDIRKDQHFIIPIALYISNKNASEADIERLERIYFPNQIIRHLRKTTEKTSNEICELVARRYAIPVFSRYQQPR